MTLNFVIRNLNTYNSKFFKIEVGIIGFVTLKNKRNEKYIKMRINLVHDFFNTIFIMDKNLIAIISIPGDQISLKRKERNLSKFIKMIKT